MEADFPQIPDKVYFRIGEVSDLVGVEPHVLRYWESEFALIRPFRGKSKQRLYRRKDVQLLLVINSLLHQQGYTLAGAKKYLKQMPAEAFSSLPSCEEKKRPVDTDILQQIKQELRNILEYLDLQKDSEGKTS